MLHTHPVYSQTLATQIEDRADIGEIVRAHHERWDGKGYPDGLAGEAIPWPARCLAVAVGFVESGLGKNAAIEAILAQSGRAYDPEAVRLFLKVSNLVQLPRQVREILREELQPGMVLANGLYSPARHAPNRRRSGSQPRHDRQDPQPQPSHAHQPKVARLQLSAPNPIAATPTSSRAIRHRSDTTGAHAHCMLPFPHHASPHHAPNPPGAS